MKSILSLVYGLLLAEPALLASEGVNLSVESFTFGSTTEGRPESCLRKADGAWLSPPSRQVREGNLKLVPLRSTAIHPNSHSLLSALSAFASSRFNLLPIEQTRSNHGPIQKPKEPPSAFHCHQERHFKVVTPHSKCPPSAKPDEIPPPPPSGSRHAGSTSTQGSNNPPSSAITQTQERSAKRQRPPGPAS